MFSQDYFDISLEDMMIIENMKTITAQKIMTAVMKNTERKA